MKIFYSKPVMRNFLLLICLVIPLLSWAQIGGTKTYNFINLPATPRITATGGNLITVMDDDPGLGFVNPALLNPSMDNKITANSAIYFSGINFGYFGYTRAYEGIGTFQTGIQYISYGRFSERDETGIQTGSFSASEYNINIGGARQYDDKYSVGANWKMLVSSMGNGYTSLGTALDLALAYSDSSKYFTTTLLIKNIGFQFKAYEGSNREPLPFDIQIGFSKRFKKIPFRISAVYHNLHRFNLRYEDDLQTEQNVFGEVESGPSNVGIFFDNLMRHFIIGGELTIAKVVRIGFGYNHQLRQSMIFDSKKGVTGFSFGIGIKIKQFDIGFARGRYHLAGALNHFSIGVNLNKFTKKRAPKNQDG